MAKQNVKNEGDERLESIETTLTRAEQFVIDNQKAIIVVLAIMVVAVLAFVTIFLFKKRMLQIRLTIFSSVVLIGYYLALAALIFMTAEDTSFTPSWTICLPFIGIVLNWLAIRGIGADEALVKAYDRLR